ncbi:MAG: YfhO family protein [Deltaproteobacteria bacterium]|nr:YfhO family protein [Deltaproteobacteria bacterium]
MNKERLTGAILFFSFTGLIILYFWEALAQSNLMVERDLPIFFFPNLKLWVEALKAGELPLWNPYSFSGQPLFASLQTSILYPPNVLLLILPLDFAFNLTIVLHFFLSGWFVFLLTRELGGSRPAGILACISFTLGGFLLSIHNVLNTLQSATWTPLIFFFFLRALRERSWKYPFLSIITILIQFLGGGIEAFLLTQAMLLFLAVFSRSLGPRPTCHSWKWRLSLTGIIFLLFAGLGAVQIIPFWEMTRNSLRYVGFSYQEATRWSLGWMDLFYVFLPDFFWRGIEFYKTDQNYLKSIYLGVIPFMMVLFFFLGKDRRKGWFGLFLSVSLLLALGRNTPLYQCLYLFVPGIQMIRYPVKFFFITNLFICLLTGLGWDALTSRLQEDPQKKLLSLKRASLVLAFFLVLILLTLFLFKSSLIVFLETSFPVSKARPWGLNLHNLERFSFFALLTFLFFVFLADRKISFKKGQTVLILLLILDLFLANWGFYRRVDPQAFYSLSPNLEVILSDPEKGRIYVDPMMNKTELPLKVEMDGLIYYILKENLYFEYPLVHKIFNTSGFGIMTYHPYQDLLTVLNEKDSHPGATDILRLMNVKYILWHKAAPDPGLNLIRRGETYVIPITPAQNNPHGPRPYQTIVAHLYENKDLLPRVFLATHYQVVGSGKERIDLIRRKGFNPAKTVILEETPEPPPPVKGLMPDQDRVRIIKRRLNQMDIEASGTGPRILFLSETYYPGWKVRVDGEEGKIYRANHAFRAIALGPGHHTIRLFYDPFSLKIGLAITLLTLIGMLCFLFWLVRK